jgi:hypothetical protein
MVAAALVSLSWRAAGGKEFALAAT